ncbi:MAG: hypothetical protein R3B72_06360 [Polyangiaceae bacterium]
MPVRTTMAALLGLGLSLAVAAACGGDANLSGEGGSSAGVSDLPLGRCRGDGDCADASQLCLGPTESIGCGACEAPPDDPCLDDAECKTLGAHFICAPQVCACDPGGGNACTPGCSDDSACPEGHVCGVDNRCEPKPCQGDGDCPVNFACGTDDQVCLRIKCTTDAACDGYCVEGFCAVEAGICSEQPA